MSSYFTPSGYTDYQKTTQWINLCIAAHDNICWCKHPWKHLMQGLLERGAEFELDKKDIRMLQKCLITTAENGGNQKEETSTTTKEDNTFDIDAGDLERLFAIENEETG